MNPLSRTPVYIDEARARLALALRWACTPAAGGVGLKWEAIWELVLWRLESLFERPQGFGSIRRAVSQGMNRGVASFASAEGERRLEWRLLGDRVEARSAPGTEWRFLDPALYPALFPRGVQGERVQWALASRPYLPGRRYRLQRDSSDVAVYVVDDFEQN